MKELLLQCASPDSVMRLGNSRLMQEAQQRIDQYFTQEHSSLADFLIQQLSPNSGDKECQDVMAQVKKLYSDHSQVNLLIYVSSYHHAGMQ